MKHALKEIIDLVAFPYYILCGSRPWSIGYYTKKKRTIIDAIESRYFFDNKELPFGFGRKVDERSVEYPWAFSKLSLKPGEILDAGSALNHDFLLKRLPSSKKSRLTVMTLAPEKLCYWKRNISYVYGDLRKTIFKNNAFDTIISISTIEHIGFDNSMLYTSDGTKNEKKRYDFISAIKEFRRIIKDKGLCLLTVPYGKRVSHRWFQVFDEKLVEMIIETFCPSEYSIDYFGYSIDGWIRCKADSVKNATFYDIHQKKKLDDDFAAGARAVACIRMVA